MKVIALGEVLLRLSTPEHLCLSQTHLLESQFGGSELNVLGDLAHLGLETAMVTRLPDNAIGQVCKNFIGSHGVGTDYVELAGPRLGLYFYERGFAFRPNQITYDRAGSAFSELGAGQIDWKEIFYGANWFHVSGITPALNQDCFALTLEAMQMAKKMGLTVSLDLNYRESLWSSFEEARKSLSQLAYHTDICIGLEPLSLPGQDGQDWKDEVGFTWPYDNKELLLEALEKLRQTYGFKKIAFTQRQLENNLYRLKAFLYSQEGLEETDDVETYALDRVGTGDAFTAGIIYGYQMGKIDADILKIGMASFVYKHTIEGDISLLNTSQLERLLGEYSQEISR
ncbi:sugar kinase [Streptococcus gallolyticus]|nr:sugar kinase [Streptococcus gallolyticus]MBY5041226.1 sugar kinase [Streptococcus gallolyticus]